MRATLPATPGARAREPRWYSHPYNRPALYRLAAGLGWLPRPARLGLARRLGHLAAGLVSRERAAIRKLLARSTGATGPRLEGLTSAVFADFAMFFSELVSTNRLPLTSLAAYVGRVDGLEHLAPVSGGLISLTAHVGNWELAGRLLAGRAARTTHVVVAEEEVRDIERWVRRDGDGVRFVTRSRPTSSLELVAALRRGEVVAVQGDRALGNGGDTLIPFFGEPAPFPLGPFLLAGAVGVPLVPAFCLFEADRRYAVRVEPAILVERGAEEHAARTWVAVLEQVVRAHPTQWFNFFDSWDPFGTA